MEEWLQWQRRLVPEAVEIIRERYGILRQLRHEGSQGRRLLATRLGISERTARHHIEFLREAGFVYSGNSGVSLTPDGEQALEVLADYVGQMSGLNGLARDLEKQLKLVEVLIVPGDSDQDVSVLQELGRAGASVLAKHLKSDSVVAVGGGSTLAQVAKAVNRPTPGVIVVPARGGLGENVEVQANTVAAVLAHGLGGSYRMIHMPDGLTEETVDLVLKADPMMGEVAKLIRKADILIQGIGRSEDMARRRHTSPELFKKIQENGAVGEAMGYYFRADGEPVYDTGSLGMKLNDLGKINFVLAVAGGSSKANAILAVVRSGGQHTLVIDEGAAWSIAKLLKE